MTHDQIIATRRSMLGVAAASLAGFGIACARTPEAAPSRATAPAAPGVLYAIRDTVVASTFAAAGVANPEQQATLSTKLMGTVTEVLVREGDRVSAGQALVRIDARDIAAKSAQVAAGIAEAEAVHRDAVTQANRIRSLYADSAATRAQLDAVETGVSRADAALRAAKANVQELEAVSSYAVVRAPFAGVITKRHVDAGAFAAPGAPLVSMQDASRIRITAVVTPELAGRLRRGQAITGEVGESRVTATIEGVVPAASGNLYAINAVIANAGGAILPGSTATLDVPTGPRTMILVPAEAVVREGDLAGVVVHLRDGEGRRWVRLGAASGNRIEVLSGLRAGDTIVVSGRAASRDGAGS